jgi:hypothetical protein
LLTVSLVAGVVADAAVVAHLPLLAELLPLPVVDAVLVAADLLLPQPPPFP